VYWRYISENKEESEKEKAAAQAREAYEAALAIARMGIPPNRPTSLGLVWNYPTKKPSHEYPLAVQNNGADSVNEAD
jgi:hypothetical protein